MSEELRLVYFTLFEQSLRIKYAIMINTQTLQDNSFGEEEAGVYLRKGLVVKSVWRKMSFLNIIYWRTEHRAYVGTGD